MRAAKTLAYERQIGEKQEAGEGRSGPASSGSRAAVKQALARLGRYDVQVFRSVSLALLAIAGSAFGAEGLVRLIDPLDEPEHYCLDVPGWGRRLNLDAPLMAHTCKPGAADELFEADRPNPGQLYMRAYDRCVEAGSSEPRAEVFTRACSSSGRQRFKFETDGRIRLSGSDLCLTVAAGRGTPTGGPSHLRRDLSLQPCGAGGTPLSVWAPPKAE